MTTDEHRREAERLPRVIEWFRAFWYHDTIDEMQRKMLREIPKRYRLRGLPPGVFWNPDTLTVSGIPTREGNYAVTLPIRL